MADETPRTSAQLIVSLALSAALAPLNSTMVAVALPAMVQALAIDSGLARQGLVTSYLLTSIVVQSSGGKLGDRLGYHRALGLGQLVFALGAAVASTMPHLGALTAARIVMAAGGAIIVPSATALLRTELPPEQRGRAFGAFGAVMALSAAIGPKIGGMLVTRFGWESIFLVNVPVIVVAAILARLGRPNVPPSPIARSHARFDLVGALLLGASLTTVVVGTQNERLRPLVLVGALGLVPFALWERRVEDPVVDLRLFRLPAFVGGGLIIALHNLAMYSLLFELPQVAGRLFGAGPSAVGNTLVAMMATMVVVSPLAGRASERFGARVMALLGSGLGLAGIAVLWFRPFEALSSVIPALVLLGFGLGFASAPAQAAAMSAVPREQSGMAASLTATMRYLGGVAGLSVLGIVLTETQTRAVVLAEHRSALIVFAGALALSLLSSLTLPKSVAHLERA